MIHLDLALDGIVCGSICLIYTHLLCSACVRKVPEHVSDLDFDLDPHVSAKRGSGLLALYIVFFLGGMIQSFLFYMRCKGTPLAADLHSFSLALVRSWLIFLVL